VWECWRQLYWKDHGNVPLQMWNIQSITYPARGVTDLLVALK
jgi:hypothetical protein